MGSSARKEEYKTNTTNYEYVAYTRNQECAMLPLLFPIESHVIHIYGGTKPNLAQVEYWGGS
jgi:hypothetical protein